MTRPVAWREVLGFVPLPPSMLAAIAAVTLAYVSATEGLKRRFHRRAEAIAGGAR